MTQDTRETCTLPRGVWRPRGVGYLRCLMWADEQSPQSTQAVVPGEIFRWPTSGHLLQGELNCSAVSTDLHT